MFDYIYTLETKTIVRVARNTILVAGVAVAIAGGRRARLVILDVARPEYVAPRITGRDVRP